MMTLFTICLASSYCLRRYIYCRYRKSLLLSLYLIFNSSVHKHVYMLVLYDFIHRNEIQDILYTVSFHHPFINYQLNESQRYRT